jgi:hypothetical protein
MQIGNAGTWHKEKRNAVQVQLCKKNWRNWNHSPSPDPVKPHTTRILRTRSAIQQSHGRARQMEQGQQAQARRRCWCVPSGISHVVVTGTGTGTGRGRWIVVLVRASGATAHLLPISRPVRPHLSSSFHLYPFALHCMPASSASTFFLQKHKGGSHRSISSPSPNAIAMYKSIKCEFEISPVRLVQNTTGWQLHAERQSDRPKRYLLVCVQQDTNQACTFRPLYFESSHDYPALGSQRWTWAPSPKRFRLLSLFLFLFETTPSLVEQLINSFSGRTGAI